MPVGTNITFCGCAATEGPPSLFPLPGTSLSCLATGSASPLVKRSQVFVIALQGFKFTCNVDAQKNPFQDCLNNMAAICTPSYVGKNPTRISGCKTSIDQMFSRMNPRWQAVLQSCALWKARSSASACNTANNNLIAFASYNTPDGPVKISSSLTESFKPKLWNNRALV